MNIVRRQDPNVPNLPAAQPWDPFNMLREMMRWDPFREMSPLVPATGLAGMFVPDVDIEETPKAFLFKADLPGIKEKDVEISLTGNRLTMKGKREVEKREEKGNYYATERSYGSFSRTFTLPVGTDPEHALADLKDGVLTITVPKKAEAQAKAIPVNAGAPKPQAKA